MDTLNQTSNVPEKKPSKFVHVSIIIAIVIVINLFSNYAVSLIYKEPTTIMKLRPGDSIASITCL